VKVGKVVDSHDHDHPWKSPIGDNLRDVLYSPYVPFPSMEFQHELVTCLSIRIDRQERLWMLDFGQHGMSANAKIYAFTTGSEPSLVLNHTFPSAVAGFGSMLNDFQVDPIGRYVYIADTSAVATTPAIVVFDSQLGISYRLLSNHQSMHGDSILVTVQGYSLQIGPFGFKFGVDSIALTRDGEQLYYGAVTNDKLYKLPTVAILAVLEDMQRAGRIVSDANDELALTSALSLTSSEKPVTDGLSSDNNGNIWLTVIEHSAIAVAIPAADGSDKMLIRKVIEDDRLRWPDGLSFGPSGLYITTSALHLKFSSGEAAEKAKRSNRKIDEVKGRKMHSWNQLHGPFYIYRIDAEAIRSIIGDELPYAGH
jgi:sugar lactone lactonase YvrE